MSSPNSKLNRLQRFRLMAAGLAKYMPNQTLTLSTGSATTASLVTGFNGFITQQDSVSNMQAAWRQQLAALNKSATGTFEPQFAALKSYLIAVYGASNQILTEFGVTPRKKPVETVTAKAEAKQKSAATREARMTMGKKQKQTIHGTATEPAAPAATPAATPPAASTPK